jgi:protease I
MSDKPLHAMRVAILIDDGFEQVEMTLPRRALDDAGAETRIVSPKGPDVRGWNFTEWGERFLVDDPLDDVNPDRFDALHLPGGVMNPDSLRIQPKAVRFVKSFFGAGKPVSVICHGPWTIIETGYARGRRMTSWPSLRTDLLNAGADWVDEPADVDRGLVSSRNPNDIPEFNRAMIELFREAHERAVHHA